MLLKRQEQDNKVKVIYKSSNILASILEQDTKNLTIIFKNGSQYQYTNVDDTDYMRFEMADSQGKVLNSHIKKYAFTKLDSINTADIILEVEDLSTKEETTATLVKQVALLDVMTKTIAEMGPRNDMKILSQDRLEILKITLNELIVEEKVEEAG